MVLEPIRVNRHKGIELCSHQNVVDAVIARHKTHPRTIPFQLEEGHNHLQPRRSRIPRARWCERKATCNTQMAHRCPSELLSIATMTTHTRIHQGKVALTHLKERGNPGAARDQEQVVPPVHSVWSPVEEPFRLEPDLNRLPRLHHTHMVPQPAGACACASCALQIWGWWHQRGSSTTLFRTFAAADLGGSTMLTVRLDEQIERSSRAWWSDR